MFNTPELLNNPNNTNFNLEESEIYSFKEANELSIFEIISFAFSSF